MKKELNINSDDLNSLIINVIKFDKFYRIL